MTLESAGTSIARLLGLEGTATLFDIASRVEEGLPVTTLDHVR